MKILENFDLTKFNTFGVKASARFFVELEKEEDIQELLSTPEFKDNKKLFLGKGSNILFTQNYDGIIVSNKLKGIEILEENQNNIFIKAMSGESWHDFVLFTVNRGYWGAENLSLIPGTVGAAPVQNIGAYGVEVKDIIENVEAYEIKSGQKRVFQNTECKFGYRESIFKNEIKGEYFIASVTFKMSKKVKENGDYRSLKEYLEKNEIVIKTPKDISDAVIAVRQSKLPNPAVLGNAGSFFKNIYINKEKADELKLKYSDIPLFEDEESIKVPAGWLIEKCGWKGRKIGNVGMHEKQALVLVNYGGATGKEIKEFSDQIIASVLDQFGLKLVPEVNIV